MQLSPDYSSICVAGNAVRDSKEPGIKQISPDQAIAGIVYVLTEKGDHILIFKV